MKRLSKRALALRILSIVLLLFTWASLSLGVFALDDGWKTVKMGYFEFGGMFEGASEGAPKSGYCYEYMTDVSVYTGWKFEYVYGTYAELYEKLKNGEIDVLPYTNYNEQRAKEVLFSSKALLDEEYYLTAPAGVSLEELNGRSVSTLEGADYNGLLLDYVKTLGLDLKVEYYSNLEDTWEALRRGYVDATVITSNAYSPDDWECVCTFGAKPTYIAIAKDRGDLLAELNDATTRIEHDSPALMGELYAKYFSENPTRTALTADEKNWIATHDVLRVGGFSENPTDLNLESDGPTGLTVDLINGIKEKLSLDVSVEYSCFNTIEEMKDAMDAGEIDVFYPFYPGYYIAEQRGLIISNTVREASMELIYKNTVTYEEALTKIASPIVRLGVFYLQDNFPNSEIVPATSVKDAVDRVYFGEALGAVAYNQAIDREKGRYEGLNSIILTEGCGTCFATLPENHSLITLLNRGMNYFTKSEISALASKYSITPQVTLFEFLQTHNDVVILMFIIAAAIAALVVLLILTSRLRKKADAANRSKTSFLFNMSHDIRTPMNAILGYTEMALNHVEEPDRVEDSLKKIKASGNHLLGLINDILEMSRIEAGKTELVNVPLDVEEAAEKINDMSLTLAATKDINFTTVIGDLPNRFVYADELHVNQIIINLISNAIKYTKPYGSVSYRLEQTGAPADGVASYRITVSDNGIGMSEEFQHHLFESFSREKTSTVSKEEGTGLGLAIVKRIVDLSGGTIEVSSAEGRGSTFTVVLPFRVMNEAEIEAFCSERVKIIDADETKLRNKTVLLVEDNELNREIATDILEEKGLIVESVTDGADAIIALKDRGPDYYDFILMDIQMPVMNGYEATKIIRERYPDKKIPIIALSANAFEEDRATSKAAGMNEHVAKPINAKELFSVMAKYL